MFTIISISKIILSFFSLSIFKRLNIGKDSQVHTCVSDTLCPLIVTSEIQSFVHSMNIAQQNDWHKLESMVNQNQNNFSIRLRKNFPMCTENDIHIILLIRINITHANIAIMMNIQCASFRISRCRLKKKMKIEANSFSEYIRKLYTE